METIAGQIQKQINNTKTGVLFTYHDFKFSQGKIEALSQTLSRLVKKGIIERLRKGVFYKPQKTKFGNIKPSETEILRSMIDPSNSYVTGLNVFNNLGLTTQISNEVVIATPKPKKRQNIHGLKIKYVKGLKPEQENDIQKLQLLDALKNFKTIPDKDTQLFIKIIEKKLDNLARKDLKRLINLAKKYNPATRALLGAVLESMDILELSEELKITLNKTSKYSLNVPEEVLPNKKNWSII